MKGTLRSWQPKSWFSSSELLREKAYRRLWTSVLASSFGAQIMTLCLPLTAAVSLHASPTQMGVLVGLQTLPFVLFALPAGVWLDRARKLPIYIIGELVLVMAAASVPIAWWSGHLEITWLYFVSFIIGLVNTTAGSASQIVLTQIVGRDRLVEANSKNALATSGAEVAGPGLAGALVRIFGAPIALMFDAMLLLLSAYILKGIRITEHSITTSRSFWTELKAGLVFVKTNKLLVSLALVVAAWQFCANAAIAVNILFATRVLGMSGEDVGLSYVCLGIGTVLGSIFSSLLIGRIGIGSCLSLGFAMGSCGFLILAAAPVGIWGHRIFALDLLVFGFGTVLVFVNFISVRQAVTPPAMLGRMTSTMRWLILIPAGPGAIAGGWLGQYEGFRTALGFAGCLGIVVTAVSFGIPILRKLKTMPVYNLAVEF